MQIGPVPSQDIAEALRLVFRDLPQEEQDQQVEELLTHGRSGRVALDGLLAARREGRLCGVQFWQVLPGRTALVWPPRVVSGESARLADELIEVACRRLTDRDVQVAYTILDTVSPADDAVLRSAGFDPLADLLYLASPSGQFPSLRPASPLEFETYCHDNHGRLVHVVEASYEQTLDCPRLNGVRAMEDVLAGYRATGVFDPERWLIVRHAGRDVGCLILADHPNHDNCELVYMGLVPSARGNGWGMLIARHGQWQAGRLGRQRMVLAVDAENAPAIAMYGAVGFKAWDRRHVYVRVFA